MSDTALGYFFRHVTLQKSPKFPLPTNHFLLPHNNFFKCNIVSRVLCQTPQIRKNYFDGTIMQFFTFFIRNCRILQVHINNLKGFRTKFRYKQLHKIKTDDILEYIVCRHPWRHCRHLPTKIIKEAVL